MSIRSLGYIGGTFWEWFKSRVGFKACNHQPGVRMGRVVTKALLSNDEGRGLIKNDQLTEKHLRQLECELNVDTGSRAVGLPLSIIEQLGLPPMRKVTVMLSDGSRQERQMYGELCIQVGDRDDMFSCVVKPEEVPLLLG